MNKTGWEQSAQWRKLLKLTIKKYSNIDQENLFGYMPYDDVFFQKACEYFSKHDKFGLWSFKLRLRKQNYET